MDSNHCLVGGVGLLKIFLDRAGCVARGCMRVGFSAETFWKRELSSRLWVTIVAVLLLQ